MRVNGFIAIPLGIVVTLFVRRPKTATKTSQSHGEAAPDVQGKEDKTPEELAREKKEKRKAGLTILKKPVFMFFAAGATIFNLGMFLYTISSITPPD